MSTETEQEQTRQQNDNKSDSKLNQFNAISKDENILDKKSNKNIGNIIPNPNIRWVILIMATLSQMGSAICINFPAYLQLQLKQLFSINDEQYNALFTSICLPNIGLPILVGYLSSKVIGSRISFNICVAIVCFGQVLALVAVRMQHFNLMMVGRFFVGIGYTNCYSPRQEIITKWFFGKELGFALSSFLFVAKLSVVLSAYMFGKYQNLKPKYIYIPMFITVVLCLFSFLCSLIMTTLDKKYEHHSEDFEEEIKPTNDSNEDKQQSEKDIGLDLEEQPKQSERIINPRINGIKMENQIITSSYNGENSSFNNESSINQSIIDETISQENKETIQNNENLIRISNPVPEKQKESLFQTIKGFPSIYWFLIVLYGINCIMFFQTQDNNQEILKQRNSLVGEITVYIFLIPSFCQSMLSPLFGLAMDKFGKRSYILVLAEILALCCYVLFLSKPFSSEMNKVVQAIIPYIFLGFFQGLISSVKWPAISILIKRENIALAVGMALSFMNTTQIISPLIAGYILQKKSDGYIQLFHFMLFLSLISIGLSIIIHVIDQKYNNGKLDKLWKKKKQSQDIK